jgi:hypothetical protein
MQMMKRLLFLAPMLLAGCVFYAGPDAWIPARNPLPPEQIVELKKAGASDASIRAELRDHGVLRKANSDDLVALKEAGAGDDLLTAVAAAPVRTPQEAQPVYYRRGYYHDDYYYRYSAVPVIATALSLNYVFGRWGTCRRW